MDNAVQAAAGMFNQLKQSVQNIGNYFNPESNGGKNFWSTPVAQGIGAAQGAFQSVAQTQPLQVDLPSQVQNIPLVGGMAQGLVNAPGQYLQGIARTGQDIGQGLTGQTQVAPQKLLGDVAQTAQLPLMFAGGGAAEGILGQGLKDTIQQGVVTGAKYGAGFGLLGGFQSGRDITNTGQYAQNLLTNTAQGAALGAAQGGVTSGLGFRTNQMQALKDVSPNAFKIDIEDQKVMQDIIYRSQTSKDPLSRRDNQEIQNMAVQYLGTKWKDATNDKILKAFDYVLGSQNGVPQGKFPGMGLVGSQNAPEGQLLPFGETKGIEPEAAQGLAGQQQLIAQNKIKNEDPNYFGQGILTKPDHESFINSNKDFNNHGDPAINLPVGNKALIDAKGHYGYIQNDTKTIPMDMKQTDSINSDVIKQLTENNGDRYPVIVRENPDIKGSFIVVDGHHSVPTSRAIGLDKLPAIILDDKGPYLKDSYTALKNGSLQPIIIKGGMPLADQVKDYQPSLGEQQLSPDRIKELTTAKDRTDAKQFTKEAEQVKPQIDAVMKKLASQVGLDPEKDFESRVKDPDTFVRKIAQKQMVGKEDYDAKGVNDVYGGRFVVDTPQQQKQIIQALNQQAARGDIKILNQEQVDKSTYHAFHIDIEKNGVRGEIQIHNPQSLLESIVNHEIRAKTGETPPASLEQEKQLNAQVAQKMGNDQAQTLAQGIEKQKKQYGTDEPLPWEQGTTPQSQKIEDATQFSKQGTVPTQAALKSQVSKAVPPSDEGIQTRAALEPEKVAQQARLAHFAQQQVVTQRASAVAQQAENILKTPEDHMNLRFAMENPSKIDEYASQSSNPQAFKALVKQYSDFTDYILGAAKGQKMDMNTVNDYFTHIWDLSKPEDLKRYEDMMTAKNFKSGFTRERLFQTLQEGLDAGFTLKNPKVSQDIMQYANSMGKQLSSAAYNNKINELRPGGAIDFKSSGSVPSNFEGRPFLQSKVPGNQGTFVDPQIAQHEGFYQESAFAGNKAVQYADKANQFIKWWDLALGGFHGFKTTVRQMVNDPTAIPGAINNAINPTARLAFRQKAISDGVIDYGSKIGVTYGQSGDILKQDASVAEKIGSKNPIEASHRALFGGLIDTYKINLTRGIMNKFDLANPEEAKQAQAYGSQINALMGGLNYESLGRNKTIQQILRFGLLAPDFNEGKVRNVALAANLTNWSPAAVFARKNVLGEAVILAGLAELGRRITTGQFSPNFQSFVRNSIIDPNIPLPNNATFNNPQTNRTQTAKLPGSDLSDIARASPFKIAGVQGDPGHFIQARASSIVSKGTALASGTDYYGRPLVNPFGGQPDNLANRAKALLPNTLPIPGVQALKVKQGKETPVDAFLNTVGFRIVNNPDDPKAIAQKGYFDGINQAAASLNPNDQDIFKGTLHPVVRDSNGNPVINKNSLTTVDKYETLISNMKVNPGSANSLFDTEKNFQKSQPNHDPMWNYSNDEIKAYMQGQLLRKNDPNGNSSLQVHQFYNQVPQQFFADRKAWIDDLVQKGIIPKTEAPKYSNERTPLTTPAQYEQMLADPKLFASELKYQTNQSDHAPLWNLKAEEIRAYMQAEVISKNDPRGGFGQNSTVKTLFASLPQTFFAQQSQYVQDLINKGIIQPSNQQQPPQMPQAIKDFFAQINQLPLGTGQRAAMYNTPTGQQALQFLQQEQQFTNAQRADMGLPLLTTPSGSSSSSLNRMASIIRSRLPIKAGGGGSMKAKTIAPSTKLSMSMTKSGGLSKGLSMKNLPSPHQLKAQVTKGQHSLKVASPHMTALKLPKSTTKTAKLQQFKMPPIKKINMKYLGRNFSKSYGKYQYI